MLKILKSEFNEFKNELSKFDSKVVWILLSSTILFVISWYFANPKFFRESVIFIEPEDLIIEELIAFIYWFLFDFMLYFLVPFYIIKLIFKEDLKSYGLRIGEMRIGVLYLILSILIFLPIIYFISKSENFQNYFPLMQNAKDELFIFFIYELFFIIFILSWEFIFRGFLLFGLEKKFGIYSIFIQMIPFVLLHSGKPFIETFAAIFGGLFLGYLAIRTRSVYYGFLIHASILVILDLISFWGN